MTHNQANSEQKPTRSSPAVKPNAKHKVVFQPAGRGGLVAEGTTLLDAARQLGVGIEAICGGRETCHKCTIRVQEGSFAKHNLRSEAGHLTPLSEGERRLQEKGRLAAGGRLSCTARITGDLLVTVPEESQAHKQVVLKAASGRTIEVDPIIRLYYLELKPPQSGVPADRERVLAELARRFNLTEVQFDYPALQQLSEILRQANGAVTLTVWNDRLVIRVQAGYHEQPVGLAIDVGSTTLAAYLCDLRTGALLATASAMNPQVTYGDDIMSRISYANERPDGREQLHASVIEALTNLAQVAARQAGLTAEDIVDVALVGNSVMHHLVLNLNPKPLGEAPFIPVVHGPVDLRAVDLGLGFNPGARLHVLPLEAGFVGADNVGVILSEQPHQQDEMMLVIDVGTNGELLLGSRDRLLCTSSPTGPALEGAQITHGMRAAPGAIERVRIDPESRAVRFKVIGQGDWSDELPPDQLQARGICGSGIIEAVAEMFRAGILAPNGRFVQEKAEIPGYIRLHTMDAFIVAGADQAAGDLPVVVSQRDVRAIQLAKAALYVGAKFLMRELGIERVDRIVLAGAFGSVIDPLYAMILGMIPDCDLDRVSPAGNAAGDGARIALLNKTKRAEAVKVARWVQHVDLPLEEAFQELFMAALEFPHTTDPFPHLEPFLAAQSQAGGQ